MMVSLCLSFTYTNTKPNTLKLSNVHRNSQIHDIVTNKKSLPKSDFCHGKEIPSCTCIGYKSASFTLEAAVIMPIMAAFIVSLLFFFRVMQIETGVSEALTYAGRMTALEASVKDDDKLALATAEVLFRKEFSKCSLSEEYLLGGKQGVSIISSKFSDGYIRLRAIYRVKLPIKFFRVSGITITQSSCHRKWIGDDLEKDKEETYVYYTDTGKVYHSTKSCPYLDLSIRSIKTAEIAASRNKSGHKYSECTRCVAKNKDKKIVYITDYGVLYHGDISCSRLKRTIHTVKLSQVGNRKGCSKCVKAK